jgi:hypothetical protein
VVSFIHNTKSGRFRKSQGPLLLLLLCYLCSI